MYTTNLSDFTKQQRKEAIQLLRLWDEYDLPSGFHNSNVVLIVYEQDGYVLLTNDHDQVAKVSTGRLILERK